MLGIMPTYCNQASLRLDSQLRRENALGHETQFGIIRKAALFQGHGPATIAKFLELWAANGFGKIAGPERSKRQQTTLFPALD
jgi:hypothetical protein